MSPANNSGIGLVTREVIGAVGCILKAGTVSVNCYAEGDLSTPFGGYKLSGFGGATVIY